MVRQHGEKKELMVEQLRLSVPPSYNEECMQRRLATRAVVSHPPRHRHRIYEGFAYI